MYMYDMPTNDEVLAMMEAANKKSPKITEDDRAVDPFWFPGQKKLGKDPNTVGDMSGCVKVKDADLSQPTNFEEMLERWNKTAEKVRDAGKAKAPKIDDFGTFTVANGDKTPKPEEVAGKIKALKVTTVTDQNAKTTTTVEELGVATVMDAPKANPDKVVGSVKPKEPDAKSWGDNSKAKPKVLTISKADIKTFLTSGKVVKGEFPKTVQSKLADNSGAVKVKKADF